MTALVTMVIALAAALMAAGQRSRSEALIVALRHGTAHALCVALEPMIDDDAIVGRAEALLPDVYGCAHSALRLESPTDPLLCVDSADGWDREHGEVVEEEEDAMCFGCSGTGEGYRPEVSCVWCGGSGAARVAA